MPHKNLTPMIVVVASLAAFSAVLFVATQTSTTSQNINPNNNTVTANVHPIDDTAVTNEIHLANWQTYINLSLGYTFQYPDGWTVAACSANRLVLTGLHDVACDAERHGDIFSFALQSVEFNQTQSIRETKDTMANPTEVPVMIDHISARQVSGLIKADRSFNGQIVYADYVWLRRGDLDYIISYISASSADTYHNEFDAFLKTITFNDQISDWKEYTNKTYGYSFRYPDSWLTQQPAATKTASPEVISTSDPRGIEGSLWVMPKEPVLNAGVADTTKTTKQIMVGGRTAIETTYTQADGHIYLSEVFLYTPPTTWRSLGRMRMFVGTSNSLATVEQILATMKFTK